jgi:rod shape-determining protein MreD
MRYTAFLVLGVLLIFLQGWTHFILGPLADRGFHPSLLVPLLVYLGVTETNLALGASVAFLLGWVLDVIGGAPIGLYTFASVATVALARVAGLRIVTQGGVARALLAGVFAAFSSGVVIVLIAIFGKSGWVPRAMLGRIAPGAVATAVFAPLVYRLAARVSAYAAGFLDARGSESGRLRALPRSTRSARRSEGEAGQA